ncbi:MAG: four helix bundle protein [Ignavibacteria bacterium]|nr:four helix bundle protein [Ignavibacteria bacterium]
MKNSNPIIEKSFDFAIRVVNLYKYLVDIKKEYVMAKQLLRCGTSIGANIREAQSAESKADFIHKFSIALKEVNETIYWIELLCKTEFISNDEFVSINADIYELRKIVSSIILTAKSNKK